METTEYATAARRLADFYGQLTILLDRGTGASHTELLTLAMLTVFAKDALINMPESLTPAPESCILGDEA